MSGYVRLDAYPNGLSTSGHRETPLAVLFFFFVAGKENAATQPSELAAAQDSVSSVLRGVIFFGLVRRSVQKGRKKKKKRKKVGYKHT
jgi:hypothetical protein